MAAVHTFRRTQLHTVSTMVAQCCTQPPSVLGVHTFGSRWCLGLNSTRLASQLFHFYCKRPQPPRPQVEGWQTVLKLGWSTLHIFLPIHNWMRHMQTDQVENILSHIAVSDAICERIPLNTLGNRSTQISDAEDSDPCLKSQDSCPGLISPPCCMLKVVAGQDLAEGV